MVNLEARVDTAVESDTDGEETYGKPGAAARVGGGDEGNGRSELTDTVDYLAGARVVEPTGRDHPVGHVGDQHGEDPHG